MTLANGLRSMSGLFARDEFDGHVCAGPAQHRSRHLRFIGVAERADDASPTIATNVAYTVERRPGFVVVGPIAAHGRRGCRRDHDGRVV
jgi:hypothetical protein